jgi:hypothetical protein
MPPPSSPHQKQPLPNFPPAQPRGPPAASFGGGRELPSLSSLARPSSSMSISSMLGGDASSTAASRDPPPTQYRPSPTPTSMPAPSPPNTSVGLSRLEYSPTSKRPYTPETHHFQVAREGRRGSESHSSSPGLLGRNGGTPEKYSYYDGARQAIGQAPRPSQYTTGTSSPYQPRQEMGHSRQLSNPATSPREERRAYPLDISREQSYGPREEESRRDMYGNMIPRDVPQPQVGHEERERPRVMPTHASPPTAPISPSQQRQAVQAPREPERQQYWNGYQGQQNERAPYPTNQGGYGGPRQSPYQAAPQQTGSPNQSFTSQPQQTPGSSFDGYGRPAPHASSEGPRPMERQHSQPDYPRQTEFMPQQQRLFLGINDNKRGRLSPLPQAVQGVQAQLVHAGREPGIKDEFGKMFSGIGSGVGSASNTPQPSNSIGQTPPFRHTPSKKPDGRNTPMAGIGNGSSDLPTSGPGSRGGRRPRKSKDESKISSESGEDRGTPSVRGGKKSRSSHSHHHHHKPHQ